MIAADLLRVASSWALLVALLAAGAFFLLENRARTAPIRTYVVRVRVDEGVDRTIVVRARSRAEAYRLAAARTGSDGPESVV